MVLKVNVFRPQSGGTGGFGTDLNAIFDDFNQEFFPERLNNAPFVFNPDPSVLAGINDINAGIASNQARARAKKLGSGQVSVVIGALIIVGGILVARKAIS